MGRNNKIAKYQKKFEKWSAGIDYLRCTITDHDINIFSDILEKVSIADFDNSNFVVIYYNDHNVTIYRGYSPKGECYIGTTYYKETSIPIFVLEKNSTKQKEFTGQRGGFVLYGSFFRLLDIGYIQRKENSLYAKILQYINELQISRIDYRFDFFTNNEKINIIMPKGVIKMRANTRIFYDSVGGKIHGGLTGWRTGKRKSKRYLVRCYDKLLDSEKKGKFGLYADYFEWKSVYRLEYEFLNSFCSGYKGKDIQGLVDKIKGFLGFNEKKGNIFKTYDKTDLSDIQSRFKYAYTTRGYLVNCIQSGINVIGLLEEAYYKAGLSSQEIEASLQDFIKRFKFSEFYHKEIKELYYNFEKNE